MRKQSQEEIIFTQTADMLAEIVPGHGEYTTLIVIKPDQVSFKSRRCLPMLTSLPGAYQLVSVIIT